MSRVGGESLYATQPKNRKKAERLWEEFNGHVRGGDGARDPYRRMLWSDWGRCRELGVNSDMTRGVLLPEPQYAHKLAQGRFLVDHAMPFLDQAKKFLAGVPGILILADGSGTILRITGDRAVRRKAARTSNIVEGSQWLEEVSGTNGIGTAIKKKTSVHIYSFEHYCEGWHRWTCAATPILDPFDNTVLGVVDFTTIEADYRDSSVALTYGLAGQIQREMLVQLHREHAELLCHFSNHVSKFRSDRVLAVDRMGHLIRSSETGKGTERSTSGNPMASVDEPAVKEVREVFSPDGAQVIGALFITERPRRGPAVSPNPRGHRTRVRSFGGFLTRDPGLTQLLERLRRVLATDLGILLIGETGTGKELIARYVHDESNRRQGPFVPVNCGAISKELFESRFFGYARGAFTGADPKGRRGFFEHARGGTLFLDEIGELPLNIQTGLLRVLETNTFRRVGAEQEIKADCRIVAATNRPLAQAVAEGLFRSDLYYRLGVFTIHIPPLRERRDDIPVLVKHLAKTFCSNTGIARRQFTDEAMASLCDYSWPGNGRELRNVITSSIVCCEDPIDIDDVSQNFLGFHRKPGDNKTSNSVREHPYAQRADSATLRGHERELILGALKRFRSVSRVCRELGISRSTIYRRFRDFGIDHRGYID